MSRRRTAAIWTLAGLAAVATAVWRVLSFSGFTNDHYVHLARAQQVVLGAWPVRDFVDPGMPFMYLVSAAAEVVAGRALGVELAVVAAAYACGSALVLATAANLSGRLSVAVAVTGVLVVLNPRSYSYPKVLLYALAGLLLTRAAEHPSRGRIGGLALLTAVAFLFRHDHGLYIGIGALVLVLCRRDAAGVAGRIRQAVTFAGLVLLLLAPWALYVQYYGGLVRYFQSGIQFSGHEASATVIETLPRLHLGADPRANASAWLFYLFHLLPVLAAAMAWWPVAGRSSPRPAAAAAVSGIAAMAVFANAGFLREELGPRIPDAAANAMMLGAYCLGRTLDAWPSRVVLRTVCRVAAAAVLVVTLASGAALADFAGQVDNARLAGGFERVLARLDDLRIRLARPMPEDEHVPSRHAAAMMPFFAYLGRCTLPTDRMLVTGLIPEAFVLAHRGFAGGHASYFSGYYSGRDDQVMAVERMRNESVPVIVLSEDLERFRAMMPIVAAFVEGDYVKGADIEVEQNPPLSVYFRRSAVGVRDPETGWPCAHPHV
jgi:hypothetical protein